MVSRAALLLRLCCAAALAVASAQQTSSDDSADDLLLSPLAAPPTREDCATQHACHSCMVSGCAWCSESQSCVPDEIGMCDGGPEDHVGFVAGQHAGPHHWLCPGDDPHLQQPGPVMQAAGECLAMAQLGGLHRPLPLGCVRIESNGWLQIYTKGKEKRGWQKRWCELLPGSILACGKTPLSPLRPRINLTECESLAPSQAPGAKQGELALSCRTGMKRLHGVTSTGQKRWVRALITLLTTVRCQAALQDSALSQAAVVGKEDMFVASAEGEKERAAYARLGATGVVAVGLTRLGLAAGQGPHSHSKDLTVTVTGAAGGEGIGRESWLALAQMLPESAEVLTNAGWALCLAAVEGIMQPHNATTTTASASATASDVNGVSSSSSGREVAPLVDLPMLRDGVELMGRAIKLVRRQVSKKREKERKSLLLLFFYCLLVRFPFLWKIVTVSLTNTTRVTNTRQYFVERSAFFGTADGTRHGE